MIVLLALLVPSAAEWVEISQHHYTRPLRNNFPTVAEVFEMTTHGGVYHNMSLSHAWNKGIVNKMPKLGIVQRVHANINTVKAPHMQGMTSHGLYNNHERIEEYESSQSDQVDFKNVFPSASEASFDGHDDVEETKIYLSERPLATQTDVTKNYGYGDTKTERTNAMPSNYRLQKEKYKSNFVTEKAFGDNDNSNEAVEQDSSEYTTEGAIQILTSSKRVHEDHNKYSLIKNTPGEDHNSYVQKKKGSVPEHIQSSDKGQDTFMNSDNADITTEEQNYHKPEDSNNKESNQNHSIENLLKFLKVVTDTIKKNTHGGVGSKTRYLQNLKETILANIADRIERLWPERERRGRRRRAARGQLEIPSSESALMSISFLTFAVFLIKLVLQLIQTYKNKTMMVAPTVVTTVGRVAAAASRRYKP